MATEVRPKNYMVNPTESDFILEGYTIYSNLDATLERGVAIYVTEEQAHLVTKVDISDNSFPEQTWAKLRGGDKLMLGCLYRSGSGDSQNNEKLKELINHVASKDPSHLLIYGDFNYKGINWEDDTAKTADEESFF